MKKASVVGSGFAGLSAACFLAKQQFDVTVFEKNSSIGGRARAFSEQGFTFDMGPSWYWMPDVFENFFGAFGKKPQDFYDLVQLDPGFQVIFGKDDVMQIPARLDDIYSVFESIEKGSAGRLKQILTEAEFKYNIGMKELVYKPSFSWMEFANLKVISGVAKLDIFKSVSTHVRSYFKDERLIALMEFPVLFLGAMASQVPALYSLMNYAALSLGTWYPTGGMVQIINGMGHLASSMGVEVITDCEVSKIEVFENRAHSIHTNRGIFATKGVVASGDYHHIESDLLEEKYRNYDERYWGKKTFAPSCLIFYLGVNKKITRIKEVLNIKKTS